MRAPGLSQASTAQHVALAKRTLKKIAWSQSKCLGYPGQAAECQVNLAGFDLLILPGDHAKLLGDILLGPSQLFSASL